MRASAGAPVPEFGHDKTPLVGGGCYRYRLWCLNAPGLSAWEQCSTVISKNVLSGADFFGRPTPTLPSRVLTFTKVACTVLTGPRHLQCSQHLQAAHCPASASSSWTWRRTLASIALFSGNRPGNQHCDANADFMDTCSNTSLARVRVLFGKLARPRLAPRHVVDPAHIGQLGIQRLGQLSQLRTVPALPGVT